MHSKTNLSNWRTAPYNQWGFQNLRQLIPTANIQSAASSQPFDKGDGSVLDSKQFASAGEQKLDTILNDSHTDRLVVLHRGKRVWQWQAKHSNIVQPHIVFSVSKSITAMLTGVLIEQRILDTTQPIAYYLAEVKGSAYSDCSLQQLLDMQVALEFDESYLDPTGDFHRYRDSTGWNPVD